MLPVSLAGIWAASRPAVMMREWVPKTPAYAEHYFVVVTERPDGTVGAFVRNPEYNVGVFLRQPDITANADGTLALHDVPGGDLRLHRATRQDLSWFYPLETASWQYHEPMALPDGWRVGTLNAAGMRQAPIAAVMNGIAADRNPGLRSPYVQSVAIERHDTLVLDQYFYGFDAGLPHDVRSAGKSVTTLMVGRAIEDTRTFSPHSRVLPLLPKYLPVRNDDVRKERMTVENLMTMASGLACDDNDDTSPGNEDTMQSQPAGTDWYAYTLDLPMASEPGSRALYCSAGINLLGAIVASETQFPLDGYFHERFAVPMQFLEYEMWRMPQPPGAAYMAGGDRFRPRDFLKFGALILDGGRWNGRRIVDANWIAESIVPRTAPEGEGDRYGYGWHIASVPVDGRNYDVISAGGNGGQLMIVIPSLDLAMMITAGNYNQYPVWRSFLPEFVAAAVKSCEGSNE